MPKQNAFYLNLSNCNGCKACQIACKDKNDLALGIRWRRVAEYTGGSWLSNSGMDQPEGVFTYYMSTSCMHCEQPACVDVCPAAAITKRADGIVLINQDQCIGCRYCQWACPYGAPQFNEAKGVMSKCTFCDDLLAKGERPACVDACPMRALDFGDLTELRAKYGNVDALEPLPQANLTKPALVLTPHKNAQVSGKGTGKISSLPEEI